MSEGDRLCLSFCDVGGIGRIAACVSGGTVLSGGIILGVVVIAANFTADGVNIVVVFGVTGPELDLIFRTAVVVVQLSADEGNIALGKACVSEGDRLCLSFCDVVTGLFTGSSAAVLLRRVVIPVPFVAHNCAGCSIDIITILIGACVKGNFVNHYAVFKIELDFKPADVAFGKTCMGKRRSFCAFFPNIGFVAGAANRFNGIRRRNIRIV